MSLTFNPFTGALDYVGSGSSGLTDPPQVTAVYFGDPTTDGTWKISVVGGNLSFQLRESGSYVEKTAITAN